MNFLYQRKLMSTCFPGKSGEANPTQKPVVSEKQVSYNVGGSYLNTELKNAVKAADLSEAAGRTQKNPGTDFDQNRG